MPGTPATSPRFGTPRYANADAVDFGGQVNAVTDALDAGIRLAKGTVALRPPADAAHEGWLYYATDTVKLYLCESSVWREVPIGASGAAPVDTADIVDRAVTALKIELQQAWQTLTLAGGKVTGSLKYFKDSLGIVHIIPNGAVTVTLPWNAGDAAGGTFPVGYRPIQNVWFVLQPPGVVGHVVQVAATGVMTMWAAGGGSGSFSAVFPSGLVSWRGEN